MKIELDGTGKFVIETIERSGQERGDPYWGYTECSLIFNGKIIHNFNNTQENHVKESKDWAKWMKKLILGKE